MMTETDQESDCDTLCIPNNMNKMATERGRALQVTVEKSGRVRVAEVIEHRREDKGRPSLNRIRNITRLEGKSGGNMEMMNRMMAELKQRRAGYHLLMVSDSCPRDNEPIVLHYAYR